MGQAPIVEIRGCAPGAHTTPEWKADAKSAPCKAAKKLGASPSLSRAEAIIPGYSRKIGSQAWADLSAARFTAVPADLAETAPAEPDWAGLDLAAIDSAAPQEPVGPRHRYSRPAAA